MDHRGVRQYGSLLLLSAAAVSASAAPKTQIAAQPPHVKSIVRADAKTGRLVRAVIVTPRTPSAPSETPSGAADISSETSIPELIEKTARKYDVDPLLVHSVIEVESNYNPYALSPKGAQGIMQLMPGTARRFGVRNSFDVKENIEGGVRYLRFLTGLFPNDNRLAVAAYNAGEGAVWKYNNTVPPYRETEQYVNKVGQRYGKAKRAAEAKKAAQKPAPVTPAPDKPAEPVYAHVEQFVDAQGRLHLRTADPMASQAANP